MNNIFLFIFLFFVISSVSAVSEMSSCNSLNVSGDGCFFESSMNNVSGITGFVINNIEVSSYKAGSALVVLAIGLTAIALMKKRNP